MAEAPRRLAKVIPRCPPGWGYPRSFVEEHNRGSALESLLLSTISALSVHGGLCWSWWDHGQAPRGVPPSESWNWPGLIPPPPSFH